MVIKKIETRDYLKTFITKVNKEAGVIYNASKLNSIKECEDYLLNLVKNLRHNKQDNKAYIKEIDSLKEEIEILKKDNNNLIVKNKDRNFLFKLANQASSDCFHEKLEHNITKKRIKDHKIIVCSLVAISIIEAVSIVMLLWK